MRSMVAAFERRLRREFGPMPYVVVLEWHPGGHGLHAHMALPARFLEHGAMQRVWGHGFVHYRDRHGRRSGRRAGARALAAYVGKYVAKDPVRVEGGHRYEVAQGFQPVVVRRSVGSLGAGLQVARNAFVGESVELEWDSSLRLDWRGPPLRYVRFSEPAVATLAA
jgi:hypothetical protein